MFGFQWSYFLKVAFVTGFTYVTVGHVRRLVNSRQRLIDVRFVRHNNGKCRKCIRSEKPCSENCNYKTLRWMLSKLDAAHESLDMTVNSVTFKYISEVLIKAHTRGVKVRLLTSNESDWVKRSRLPEIECAGIEVRKMMLPRSERLHITMCIIDKKSVICTSSNLSSHTFTYSSDDIFEIKERKLVWLYIEYFMSNWRNVVLLDYLFTLFSQGNKDRLSVT